ARRRYRLRKSGKGGVFVQVCSITGWPIASLPNVLKAWLRRMLNSIHNHAALARQEQFLEVYAAALSTWQPATSQAVTKSVGVGISLQRSDDPTTTIHVLELRTISHSIRGRAAPRGVRSSNLILTAPNWQFETRRLEH